MIFNVVVEITIRVEYRYVPYLFFTILQTLLALMHIYYTEIYSSKANGTTDITLHNPEFICILTNIHQRGEYFK